MASDHIHELKTWPEPFAAMVDGTKTFEYRHDDRGYRIGDVLLLREWDPAVFHPIARYTGRTLRVRVTYVLHGGRFGVPDGYVVMGVKPETTPTQEQDR